MSTKTIKQRIAVVAVSALTAGLLSVVATPAANAAVVNGKENSAVGTAPLAATEHVLTIATVNSITGTHDLNSTQTSSTSVGLINVSDIAGTRISGTTQTAVLLSTGTLSVHTTTNTTPTDDAFVGVITVSGGTIVGTQNSDGMNSTRTVVVFTDDTGVEGAAIRPDSGATQMIVRLYNGTQATYSAGSTDNESNAIANAVDAPTRGSLEGQITVTIASSSSAGAIAAANSGVYYVASYSASNTATSDTAGLGAANAVSKQYGAIRIRDVYRSSVAAGGLLQVSATNGALVALADGVGSASSAFSTSVADGQGFAVANPTSNPLSTTVTVSYNGTVIGTKTYSFWGEVAKVTLSDPFIGKQGVTSGNDVKVSLFDAANNPIYFAYGSNADTASTFTPAGGLISAASAGRASSAHIAPALNTSTGVVTQGIMEFACGTTTTSSTIQVQYVNISGTIVTSNSLPITCAGDAVSYKASYDKAVYAPGEIAKLTVSFFDSKGAPANDVTAVSTSALVISTSGMKGTAIVAPGTSDVTVQGKLSYNYIVDTTEGTFTNQVVAATVNTRAANANLVPTAAATASITVKAAGTTVTNAEVLKSIVSLIASINKQIQALQKLILRR